MIEGKHCFQCLLELNRMRMLYILLFFYSLFLLWNVWRAIYFGLSSMCDRGPKVRFISSNIYITVLESDLLKNDCNPFSSMNLNSMGLNILMFLNNWTSFIWKGMINFRGLFNTHDLLTVQRNSKNIAKIWILKSKYTKALSETHTQKKNNELKTIQTLGIWICKL